MSEVEVVVPRTIWEMVLSPEADPWVAQRGLPTPEFRARGRGEQAVLRVPPEDAEAIYARVGERLATVEDAAARQRVRAWLRKATGDAPTKGVTPRRRRRAGSGAAANRHQHVIDAVRHYLELVDTGSVPTVTSGRPKERIEAEIAEVDEQLSVTDDVLARLDLLARRRRLDAELTPQPVGTAEELEDAFVRHAAAFAAEAGYDPEVFAEFGVPIEVLERAELEVDADDGQPG